MLHNKNKSSGKHTTLQTTLLCGVSVIAFGVILIPPSAARAQTYTSSTNSTVNSTGLNIYINSGVILSGNPGISSATPTTLISNQGTIVDGGTGILNTNSLGTLANTGTIAAYDEGIDNDGTIGALENLAGGTISGPSTGIYNGAGITTLTNAGTIGSFNDNEGIYNDGTIGALENEAGGTISGYYEGLYNDGTIGAIENQAGGTISGYDLGIDNDGGGGITTLINAGLIESFDDDEGIYNGGTIGALSNLAGGTIAGPAFGILNAGGITSLTNAGLIEDFYGYTAIFNPDGTIGALSNLAGGTIISGGTGIYNGGLITSLTNAGLIEGFDDEGIYNGGTIGALANLAGGVISGYTAGIDNEGTIGNLTNAGLIDATGTLSGIYNDGGIGALTNQAGGTINGFSTGIDNEGAIGALTNNGVITGGNTGIYNGGSIAAVTNSGIISGSLFGIYSGTIATVASAVIRAAVTPTTITPAIIGNITNSGTISGLTAIYLTGGGTTITNTGLIASTLGNAGTSVFFGGVDTLILDTGSVIQGTINGGGTASQIILYGNGSFDNGVENFGAGSNLQVTSNADWTASGTWQIATVTNDGIFQAGRLGTPLTLTGDYLQNPDGTLRVLVTTTTSTEFNITGTATLAGGVSYVLAPGHYTPHVYPYITTTGGVTGQFTTVNYGQIPTGLATTQYAADPAVDLVITGSFYIPNIVNPEDPSIFSDESQALAQSTDADTASLLGKAIQGGAAASPACAAEAPLSPAKTSATGGGQLASTLASVFCGAGGWIEATGSLGHADASDGAPAYNANTAGFLAGIDRIINTIGSRIGFAVGYDETYLNDKAGGGGRMGTTRVALYGAQPLGQFTLAGVIAYGNASNTTSRDTGAGNLSESNSESIYSGGLQLSTALTMGGINLQPAAGLRLASIQGGSHFDESASGITAAFAVSGKTPGYHSVQPYALIEANQTFLTGSQVTITPDVEAGYEYEAGDRGVSTSLTSADLTAFRTPHNNLDAGDVLLSAGLAASKNNWSLFATYTAHLAGNWTDQTGEAGIRVTF